MREAMIIGHYLMKMVLPALAGAALCLASLPLRRRAMAARGLGGSLWHELCLALFAAFLCGLFSLIVLPSGRPAGGLHYNLIPFQIFVDIGRELRDGNMLGLLISLLGNVVMFLPLGFFPALLWRGIDLKRALVIGCCASLTIELFQLPLGRSADVDDLWLNTLGVGLGYGLYALLARWKPRWANCCKVISKTEEETPHGRERRD